VINVFLFLSQRKCFFCREHVLHQENVPREKRFARVSPLFLLDAFAKKNDA